MKLRPKLTQLLFIIVAISIFFSFSEPPFFQNEAQKLLIKSDSLNQQYPQEKIYLHIDRQSYLANDDIWFKAYILNSPVRNFNLHVELINPAGEVIYKNLSLAQYGLSYGDFHLADTLSSGMYQIRAYTSWMRNFGDDWFFRKNILVINPGKTELNTDTLKLRKRNIDLQFFPEGGTFLANQKNRVAFKAIDENGKGIDVEGVIVDNSGVVITSFKNSFKGMGSFIIEPEEGKRYSAKVTLAGEYEFEENLPRPEKYGVMLAVDATDSAAIYLQVAENLQKTADEAGNKYIVVGQAGGSIQFLGEVALNGETSIFSIDKNSLPGGIVKFTLFDQNMVPRCERLVFNNHLDTLHLKVTPNKTEYKPREEIEIDVTALKSDGTPTLTNLSMSVYSPAAEYHIEDYPGNIFTSFLLDSELKGTIEEPAYYFKDDSLSTLLALDNVMLTHGYRYFEWEVVMEEKLPEIEFLPDSSLSISGKVTSLLMGKPLADSKISMISVKSLLDMYETKSDSLGNFRFTDLYYRDTVQFTMQAKAKKNRQTTWIELNEEINSPENYHLPTIYRSYEKNSVQTYTYLSELSPELLRKKWHLSDTILLGDINVVAKKKKEDDGFQRPYMEPDFSFDVKEMDVSLETIFDVIETSSANARSQLYRSEVMFLNGMQVTRDYMEEIPPSWIEKVEFLKMYPMGRKYVTATFFYMKEGKKNVVVERSSETTTVELIGYSVFRKFYSPKYKADERPEKLDDFRKTLYWDPLVRTFSDGKAKVSFFNSDETGQMNVIVEGINEEGKLCRGVAKYEVSY